MNNGHTVGRSLGELAKWAQVELRGDPDLHIHGVATLGRDRPGTIAFLGHARYRKALATTQASAVILTAEWADACPVATLISTNPYLTYARIAGLLYPPRRPPAGIDPTAWVSDAARIAKGVAIGPLAVIEAEVELGEGVGIGPGCIVRRGARIGAQTLLVARVTVAEGTVIGRRCLIHPGAVLGSDGFGFAHDGGHWVRIPQLGRVVLGDDVDIGANTTIDRGALEDTVVEDGAKIDNLVQLGHNVHIGARAAIAGCVGIAGSTTIGKGCQLGGGCGIAGHLSLADGVILTGGTLIHNSIKQAGVYSGGLPAQPNALWRKNVARIRQLDDLARRLKALEQRIHGQAQTPVGLERGDPGDEALSGEGE